MKQVGPHKSILTFVSPNIYKYKTAKGPRYLVRLMVEGQRQKKKGLVTLEQASDFLTSVRMEAVKAKHLPHLVAKATLTLEEYLPPWLKQCERRDLRPSTVLSYKANLLRHVLPVKTRTDPDGLQPVDDLTLGQRPLDQITRQDIIELLNVKQDEPWGKNKKGLKPYRYAKNTMRLMLAPLSRLFADAYDAGLTGDRNPCLRPSRVIRPRKDTKDVPALTVEQEAAFLEAAGRVRPAQAPLCWVLFEAGLRIGEAIALEPKDVVLAIDRIRVTKNWARGHLHSTKTSRARQVEISPTLRPQLEAQLRHHGAGMRLFPGPKGSYWNVERFQRQIWEPILKEAQLPRCTPHSARHTFATRRLEAGCSLQWLSQQLGHSSIQVTVDTYGHLAQKP